MITSKPLLELAIIATVGIFSSTLSAEVAEENVLLKVEDLPPSMGQRCLAIGTKAPNFTVDLLEGGQFNLYDQLKEESVVIVFYRGGWCPYCNVQLRHYDRHYGRIKEKKASLIAISADRPDRTAIKKPTAQVGFPIGSDPDLKIIEKYKLSTKVPDQVIEKYKKKGLDLENASGKNHHKISVPAVLIIGKNRKVKWCYAQESYRVRPIVDSIVEKL